MIRFQAVTGRLHIKVDGRKEPVEFYEVTVFDGKKEMYFPTYKDGEFYLENLTPWVYSSVFSYKGSQCSFILNMPTLDDPIVDIGEVVYDRIKQ